MKPVISIGAQDFEFIRKNNAFYIDKTDFIREWWENKDSVTLIIRPRRFGKTLNMSTLNCFFSTEYADRGDLFEGLSIWEERLPEGEKSPDRAECAQAVETQTGEAGYSYRSLQGSYPVIFLTFADVKGTVYRDVRKRIARKLADLYSRYSFVKGSLDEIELQYYESVRADMDDEVAASSIHYMCKYLERYYGKKVIVLLDEYDTPLQEAYVGGYWKEMVSFTRSLFNSTFKTNSSMERGLMTGITRVSKESIFSDLNNITVVTTTSEKYRTQFGFTEKEVFDALDFLGMAEEKDSVKKWYDGFTFGGMKDIYNPWSITNFLENKKYMPYWANNSSNALVNSLIREGDAEIKMTMENLLAGKTLETVIDEEIVFDQLSGNDSAIWSLLLASGYLKIAGQTFTQEAGEFTYCLELTNGEVRLMFRNMIKGWFPNSVVPYNGFLKALLAEDVDYMNEYMETIADKTFSTFDAGKKPSEKAQPERFYHGFVLGLIVELAGKYEITSNQESGLGRYDVMLMPLRPELKAYIFEFKVRNARREETLEDTLKAALAQIENRNYDAKLIAKGVRKDDIRHYGFAFEGKKVLIG